MIIEWARAAIGYLQLYPWSGDPEEARDLLIPDVGGAWGLDIFIGEPASIGLGLGARAVDLACRYAFAERGATMVALVTELGNLAAQRAYEKAGFAKVRRVLDTDTRGGERIAGWLMVRAK